MDKTASDLLNGFVKRAQQHGLNNEEITHLVKKANPELMELWNALKGYAGQAGRMAKKHIVNPVMQIPEHYRGMTDASLQGYKMHHLSQLARGAGTATLFGGIAGLGAYGAGKAMFGNNQPPSQSPQMPQPNMPQQLQQ